MPPLFVIETTLLQLSDLHFRSDAPLLEERRSYVRGKLEDDVKAVVEKAGIPKAIVVTGDIAYSGKKADYDIALPWLHGMCDVVGVPRSSLLCVPGNHDVDWARIGRTPKDQRIAMSACTDSQLDAMLDEYLAEAEQPVLGPMGAYNSFAVSAGCPISNMLHWDWSLPMGAGYEICFRGITTTVNSGPSDTPGSLAVHSNSLQAPGTAGRVNVFLAHHDPYFWRRHHDLSGLLENCASLALFGHTHQPRMVRTEECVVLTAGAVHPDVGDASVPAYNLIRLWIDPDRPDELHVEAYRRRFSHEHQRFLPHDGQESEEREVKIVPVRSPRAAQSADGAVPDTADEENETMPPAIALEDGSPAPLKLVLNELYNLGGGRMALVLNELGLWNDELAELPLHQQIPVAATRIADDAGLTDAFLKRVHGK